MTAWGAVAVCEVIQQLTGLQATIKWPNDILVAGKKVCGFLIEQKTTGRPEAPLATVVGLGLNVTQPADDFAAANLPDAASLASLTGKTLSVDAVARDLFHRMDDEYERLLSGDLASLEALWQWRLGLIGNRVVVETAEGARRGELLDVAFDGVTLKIGHEIVHLVPEAVRQVMIDKA